MAFSPDDFEPESLPDEPESLLEELDELDDFEDELELRASFL